MTIFVVSGTHIGESKFAKLVASRLERILKHATTHAVERVHVSENAGKRKALGITSPWLKGSDPAAAAVFQHLRSKGFDPGNETHLVLDLHENPVNWQEVYANGTDFYSIEHPQTGKSVDDVIRKSLSDGHLGLYFAEVKDSAQYGNVSGLARHELALLKKTNVRFVRIELPVIGERAQPNHADVEETLKHLHARTRKEAVTLLANMVFCFLPPHFRQRKN